MNKKFFAIGCCALLFFFRLVQAHSEHLAGSDSKSVLGTSPLNSPYAQGAESTNTLFTAFTGRSPNYLDPTSSYSSDETPFTYQIYEPLFAYHYLKRPYQLIPRAASALVDPQYLDKQGRRLSSNAPGEQIAESVYDISIKNNVFFQPHPAFAKNPQGQYLFHKLPLEQLKNIYSLNDFPHTGTRLLSADDFVYAIKRLASPRVVSPLFGHMSEYIVGLKEYGQSLRQADKRLRQGLKPTERDLPWLDLRQYDLAGVQALDHNTLRVRVKGKYPQFKYWLAMTFFAPIPWEADYFYSQTGMAAKNFSLNYWPVGTGPYMQTEYVQNRRHVLQRNPNFRGEPYPCEGEAQDAVLGFLKDCGKLTPFIDRLVFSIEKEAVPLQNKFMQGYYDIPQAQRGEYGVDYLVAIADDAKTAALFKDRGILLPTTVETQSWYMGFNWLDPIVGKGNTPAQQEKNRKLRQAISIALDWEEYLAIFEKNQGLIAQGPLPPGIFGYREGAQGMNRVVYDLVDGVPKRKSLEEAKKLLVQAGYPQGRDAETGIPLVLNYDYQQAASPGAKPQLDWMIRQFAKLGIQLEIRATDYNRFQEKMRRGSAQIFWWGWNADYPDAENFLFLLYGPNAKAKTDGENAANYDNEEYNRLFQQMKYLEDGPQKALLIDRMVDVVRQDAVWMFGYFPLSGGAYQQWVGNGKPTQMVRNHLMYMKIDAGLRHQKIAQWNRPIWWPVFLVLFIMLASGCAAVYMWRRHQQRIALQG